MHRNKSTKKKFKDVKMDILGKVRKVDEIELTLNIDGTVSLSFDEYNRISNEIHMRLRRKRNVR